MASHEVIVIDCVIPRVALCSIHLLHITLRDCTRCERYVSFALSTHAAYTGVSVPDYVAKDRCELTSSNPGDGSLRLVGGPTNNTGVVQVYLSGRWGGICADGIQHNNEALEVAC